MILIFIIGWEKMYVCYVCMFRVPSSVVPWFRGSVDPRFRVNEFRGSVVQSFRSSKVPRFCAEPRNLETPQYMDRKRFFFHPFIQTDQSSTENKTKTLRNCNCTFSNSPSDLATFDNVESRSPFDVSPSGCPWGSEEFMGGKTPGKLVGLLVLKSNLSSVFFSNGLLLMSLLWLSKSDGEKHRNWYFVFRQLLWTVPRLNGVNICYLSAFTEIAVIATYKQTGYFPG